MDPGCPEDPAWPPAQRGQREGSARRQEEGDACVGAAEPQPPQLPPGKLKKTALKLFGGKRSICTLPSFFGGRSKGQGKVASKKGLSKCQTHDGLSAAACDKGGVAQPESPLEGSGDSHPCPLPSSQSAHVALAPSTKLELGHRDSSPPRSIEGCEKKPTGEKSSCPRAKKGLRGFFNSIRRHRKSKAAEGEKAELPEWNRVLEEAGKAPGVGLASEGAVEEGRVLGAASLPAGGPGSVDDERLVGSAAGCGEAAQPGTLPADGGSCEGDTEVMAGQGDVPGTKLEADAVVCAEFDRGNQLLAFHPDFMDTDPTCLHSGDLLNLILGDVASLKSFDSLTGCGDDIAEPDIAESSLSVEHSRNAAKRSSCLVTFQGGGEEMAIPEEAEEFLPQPWDSRAAGDRSYGAQVSRSSLETHASHEAGALPYVGDAMDGVDLLTPQSDQQESAPNSDEGYYDSTTPGLEDEAGDGLGEMKKDPLPRDSYSGDALYEFDVLLSPSHGEESLFESKVSRPEIFSYFLDLCLPAEEESVVRVLDQKRGVMETEEERLVAIQKELLYWELQREPVLKRLGVPSQEKCPREKPWVECNSRAGSCIGKNQSGLGGEPVGSQAPHRAANSGELGARAENHEWRDFPRTPCPETCYESQKAQGSCLTELPQENAGFDSDPGCGLFGGSLPGSAAPAEAGLFPGYRRVEQERGGGVDAPAEPPECSEPEHAVSFSQALVEFASSGTLFSSLSESLGSSGSSFAQNLPALPTMVTFDVVDVEQEGEGECEQHCELNGGEDIAEAFDNSFVRKESLAECEEATSPGWVPGSFPSGSWGVASLPRHLRLHGLSPCRPAPLSLDRRSRSLDTESLEFELAGLQVGRSGPQPGQLWEKQEGGRQDLCRARRSRSKEEDVLVAPNGGSSWLGSQHLQHDGATAARRSELRDLAASAGMESAWEPSEQAGTLSPFPSLPRSVAGETLDGQPPLRPSSLPLQSEGRCSREVGGSLLLHGEGSAKTVSHVFPLGEPEPRLPPSFGFALSPEKRAKCRPIGIAQGVRQHPSVSSDTSKSPERCGDALKGRALPGHTVPAVNVTGAE